MKVKATISYDGSKYHGFQIQTNSKKLSTVAGELTKILKNLNISTNIVGSGRTDTGVHATAQVIHFELPPFWDDVKKLKKRLNQQLSPSLHVKDIQQVDESFHARFHAQKRLYRYVLYTGVYQPFLAPYALHVKDMKVSKLNAILKKFIGIYDFEYFKKTGSITHSDTRELFKAGAYQYDNLTIIYFLGNSFLRSQVRMMGHFALEIMRDNLTLNQLKEQLHKKQKYSTGVLPANGLYLSKIYY